jgi:hemolysin III
MSIHHPRYTTGEEIANSITHGVGALMSLVGLILLSIFAGMRGDAWHQTAVAIFGTSLILLYLSSTLYHSLPGLRVKAVLRILDHAAIYLLIAGTYTPFTLVTLRGPWGWSLFGVVWGLALVGVILTATPWGHNRVLSMMIYIGMGWVIVVAFKPLLDAMAPAGIVLLVAGGLVYTVGIVFYGWRSLRYHHTVWHLFVLTGSILHYLTVFFYVIPSS